MKEVKSTKDTGGRSKAKKPVVEPVVKGETLEELLEDIPKPIGDIPQPTGTFRKFGEEVISYLPPKVVVKQQTNFLARKTSNAAEFTIPTDIITEISLAFPKEEIEQLIKEYFNEEGFIPMTSVEFQEKKLFATLDSSVVVTKPQYETVQEANFYSLKGHLKMDGVNPKLSAIATTSIPKAMGFDVVYEIDYEPLIAAVLIPRLIESGDGEYDPKNLEMGKVVVYKNDIFIGLRPGPKRDFIKFNKKNFVITNMSMSHERFIELAEETCAFSEVGVKVHFERVSNILESQDPAKAGRIRQAIAADTERNPISTTPLLQLIGEEFKSKTEGRYNHTFLDFITGGSLCVASTIDKDKIREDLGLFLPPDIFLYKSGSHVAVLPDVRKLAQSVILQTVDTEHLTTDITTSPQAIAMVFSV